MHLIGDTPIHIKNQLLEKKYNVTAWFYDILDYPWERQYRHWRPELLKDVQGTVLEVGVGTGRNLAYYNETTHLTGIDLSEAMLKKAAKRAAKAPCTITLHKEDATSMDSIPKAHFNWLLSTFLCCVMPDTLQPLAVKQFARVLKPGGRFRILEMVFSNNQKIRRRQDLFAPYVEKIFGARFDRNTLDYFKQSPDLQVTNTFFLKDDVYLVIEGNRI